MGKTHLTPHLVFEAPLCPKEDLQIITVNLIGEEAFSETQDESWGE